MSTLLDELLRSVSQSTEATVRRTVEQSRPKLSHLMESETRLQMNPPGQAAKKVRVPATVEPGHPERIHIPDPPDREEIELQKLLNRYRGALRAAKTSLPKLRELSRKLQRRHGPDFPERYREFSGRLPRRPRPDYERYREFSGRLPRRHGPDFPERYREFSGRLPRRHGPDYERYRESSRQLQHRLGSDFYEWSVHELQQWVAEWLQIADEIANWILGTNGDFMGVYRCSPQDNPDLPNEASIEIYWRIIGLVARRKGWPVKHLTLVVMTHELAHAYTQLGADTEGSRWPVRAFQGSDLSLKEGLAQYFTHRVLKKLDDNDKAFKVFEELTPCQPAPYRVHQTWLEHSPEAVRQAMLQVRRAEGTRLADFEEILEETKQSLA